MSKFRSLGMVGVAGLCFLMVLLAACRRDDKAQTPGLEVRDVRASYADSEEEEAGSLGPARLRAGDVFVVSFPKAMVASVALGTELAQAPVEVVPALPFRFSWTTPTTGQLVVSGMPAPDAHYVVRAKAGLRDLSGTPAHVEVATRLGTGVPFRVQYADRWEAQWIAHSVSARQQLSLFFTHPVRASEVARTVQWRDDTGVSIAAQVECEAEPVASWRLDEVVLADKRVGGGEPNDPVARRFRVTPATPLAPERDISLHIEGTRTASGSGVLPYVKVLRVGRTHAFEVERVAGFNQPLLGAFVEVNFSQPLDAGSVKPGLVKVQPEVTGLRLAPSERGLRLFGAFKAGERYRVEVAPELRGRSGFTLGQTAVWHASFPAKRPAVAFGNATVTTSARKGIELPFTQVNTGELRWRLARLAPQTVQAVQERLTEYLGLTEVRDLRTNEKRMRPTELLVDSLGLAVERTGTLPPSWGDEETQRCLSFAPGELEEGAWLLEVDGKAADGRVAGNRVLLLVNREMFVWKTARTGVSACLFDVVTGDNVAGAKVRLLARDGRCLGEAHTDELGVLSLPRQALDCEPALALVWRGDAMSAHFTSQGAGSFALGSGHGLNRENEAVHAWVFCDRGIYRPGETVNIKGIQRERSDAGLGIPAQGQTVPWRLFRGGREEPLETGEATLSAQGGWALQLELQERMPTGRYVLQVPGGSCQFKVDEFRAPAFEVRASAVEGGKSRTGEPTGTSLSTVRVASRYFHGAANAGALVRWRAEWSRAYPEIDYTGEDGVSEWLTTTDECSPGSDPRRPRWSHGAAEEKAGASLISEGVARLDADGCVVLASACPIAAQAGLAGARAQWEFSVLAPDGQTVEAGCSDKLALAQAQPAVALTSCREPGRVGVVARALDLDGKDVEGARLRLEFYRIREKTVRESLSPRVHRFRNTAEHELVETRELAAPFREELSFKGTGRFAVVASLMGVSTGPRASTDIVLTGGEPAEFAQWDDGRFEMVAPRAPVAVGEQARVILKAPFAGKAWVTVETDRILYSEFVELKGNAAEVSVPVSAEMFPSATVVAYLFRPEKDGALAERRGSCRLEVRRPETELQVGVEMVRSRVEPGASVEARVTVQCQGRAAAGAEVTLFAVDESVLAYGGWSLPEPGPVFYPHLGHSVGMESGLRQFARLQPEQPEFQKGFIIGDGGRPMAQLRRRFTPLAFWQAEAVADEQGHVSVRFDAPDNLTAYRLVAVAHRGASQFGHGKAVVEVARTLQVEPALPRFVREGDEVELAALVRLNEGAPVRVSVECAVENAELRGPATRVIDVGRDAPVVVRFPVTIGATGKPLKLTFKVQAAGSGASDAVRQTLPVHPSRITRTLTVAGRLGAGREAARELVSGEWIQATGTADLTVSGSPWLPVVDALPRLLEYPHGCNEQVSARVLAYGLMAGLLDGLPDAGERTPEYRRCVEAGLARLARSQLSDGWLPYWPGQSEANAFVTIQASWACAEAQRSGFRVPDRLREGLSRALTDIVRQRGGHVVSPGLRAMALFVASTLDSADELRTHALDLWQQRDALDSDGRAFLALALHRADILPAERRQLAAELGLDAPAGSFVPANFASPTRTQALRLWAAAETLRDGLGDARRAEIRTRLARLAEASCAYSTQENLWSLVAFRAAVADDNAPELAHLAGGFSPGPSVSQDKRALGWRGVALGDLSALLAKPVLTEHGPVSALLRVSYRLPTPEKAENRGFRLERFAVNLTAVERDGSSAHPFAIGDEVKVSFRLTAESPSAYVALEESLPAAFETVDPEYRRFSLRGGETGPEGEGDTGELSHWEKRDARTLWYFDWLGRGTSQYSVIVRVTSSGRFQWPGAVVAPMYDARTSGVSEAATIHVR